MLNIKASPEPREPGVAEAERCPSVWFCMLELAIRKGDKAGADRARRRLRSLGVEVRFVPNTIPEVMA